MYGPIMQAGPSSIWLEMEDRRQMGYPKEPHNHIVRVQGIHRCNSATASSTCAVNECPGVHHNHALNIDIQAVGGH